MKNAERIKRNGERQLEKAKADRELTIEILKNCLVNDIKFLKELIGDDEAAKFISETFNFN
jgi:hypothetical protein